MKRYYLLLSVMLILSGCIGGNRSVNQSEENESGIEVAPVVTYEYGIAVDSLQRKDGKIVPGQSLGGLLASLGAAGHHVHGLNSLDKDVFDVRTIRAGKQYSAYYGGDSSDVLTHLVYIESAIDYVVFDFSEQLSAYRGKKPVRTEERVATAKIRSSLWEAIVSSGLNMQLALDLSDIYAWNIDFFGLQAMDSFVVYYDELFVDSVSVGIGKIHAARFYHYGKDYYAYRYAYDDKEGYWDEQGNSLKKAFLKAPLKYSRISSGFTYARKHPVYRTVRPHTGVDYAAPTGTPVMSIGDGVVVEKGYKGGGGHTVKIKHNATYSSAYLHLSKYGAGVQVGSRVKQGDVIGYVGSTGSSTGPHLDFRVWQNGQPINPLKMESPPVEPIPAEQSAAFDSIVVQQRVKLQ